MGTSERGVIRSDEMKILPFTCPQRGFDLLCRASKERWGNSRMPVFFRANHSGSDTAGCSCVGLGRPNVKSPYPSLSTTPQTVIRPSFGCSTVSGPFWTTRRRADVSILFFAISNEQRRSDPFEQRIPVHHVPEDVVEKRGCSPLQLHRHACKKKSRHPPSVAWTVRGPKYRRPNVGWVTDQ